ncbi:MAG: autotransporter domain-containing protein [Puniceicoccales bacterium]|jgi:subtilisin family serine protease/uncharacterized protein YhjY with autotransporter beta-barrel domain|nr:autotransporter domain-containing protein [Puniceicoccales bacterium]
MSRLPRSLFLAGAAALSVAEVCAASFTPNDPLFNPSAGFYGQWHLFGASSYAAFYDAPTVAANPWLTSVRGNNVTGAWTAGYTGAGVIIGIIDDGIEGSHEDLAANYRADLSRNFSQGSIANQPQRPYRTSDNHGTCVAGVAAAVGGNGIGVTGAAPHAQIAGMRIAFGDYESDPNVTSQDIVNAFLWKSGVTEDGKYTGEAVVSIKNNSWGSTVPFLKGDEDGLAAVKVAASNNVIFVFAAGNARGTFNENSNASLLNGAEVMISVAAFGSDGIFSVYSNYGSSVFVTAASNGGGFGIVSTDRMGAAGYTEVNYNGDFGGTSSASPLITGIIALAKEANPALDTRWAKHAFAHTSVQVDLDDKSLSSGVVDWSSQSLVGRGWQTNGAGLHFNPNYGFGMADATAFVDYAVNLAYVTARTSHTVEKKIGGLSLSSNSSGTVTHWQSTNSNIVLGIQRYDNVASAPTAVTGTPSAGAAPVVPVQRDYIETFTLGSSQISQSLETVEVHVNISSGSVWKDLLVQIVSPSGVVSDLYTPLLNAASSGESTVASQIGLNNGLDWTFTTNAFWGENGAGEWKLVISNYGNSVMKLEDFSITFHQGEAILESALTEPISKDLSVHALVIDNAGTRFVLPEGRTFTIADSTILNGGIMEISGHVAQTKFKGNQLVVNGGTLSILPSGSVDAARGALMTGGTFNLSGKLNTGSTTLQVTTSTTAANGDVTKDTHNVTYPYGLLVTGGTLNTAGTGASVAGGILQTGGRINIAAGNRLVTPTLDVQGTVEDGGYVTRGALAIGGTLEGGLVVRNGATATATGAARITGDLVLTGDEANSGNAAKFTIDAGATPRVGGSIALLNGTLLLNSDNLSADTIYVEGNNATAGGHLDVAATTATLSTRLVQTGGTTTLAGDATFTDGITLVGGTFTTSVLAGKTLTTSLFNLQGSGRFDLGGGAFLRTNLAGDFHMNGGNLVVNIARATMITSNDRLEIAGSAVFNSGNIQLSIDVKPQIADLLNGRHPVEIVHADTLVGGFITVSGDNSYNDRSDSGSGAYSIPLSYKFQADSATGSGNIIVGYDYASPTFLSRLNANQQQVAHMLNRWELLTGILPDGQPDELLLRELNQIQDIPTLAAAYEQLMPVNSLALARSAGKRITALTNTFDRRSRDFRRGAIQPGSIWTNYLFADNCTFDFATQPRIAALGSTRPYSAGGYVPYSGLNEEYPLTLWMNGGASVWRGKSVESNPVTRSTQYTGVIGLDYRWETGLRRTLATHDIGALVGYNGGQDKIGDSGSRNDYDAIQLAAYFTTQYRGYYVNALAGYAIDQYKFKRDIRIGNLSQVAIGRPKGDTYYAYLGAGHEWEYRSWAHGPTFAAHYSRTQLDGYTETDAGSQNLTLGQSVYESLQTRIGYRITTRVEAGWATLLPEVRAVWHHEFKDNIRSIAARTNNGIPFTTRTNALGGDYATFGAGLTFMLSEYASCSFDYDVSLFQKDMEPQHTLNALLRVSF